MKKLSGILAGIALLIITSGDLLAQKNSVKEERDLPKFTKFDIGIAGEVYLKQGSIQKFEIEGDENILADIETSVSGEFLRVRFPNRFFQTNASKVKIFITMPVIEGMSISGSARVEAETPIKTKEIDFTISGSGRVKISDLKADVISSRISGSGGIDLGGSGMVKEQKITISGSGSLNAADLQIERASITISGSGSCKIFVKDYLETRISGSGSVHYSGNPQIDARISGSGKVLTAK